MTSSPPITAHLAAELPHAGEGCEVAALDGDLPGVAPYVPGCLLAPLLAPAGEDDLDSTWSAHRRLHTAAVTLAPRSARPRAVSLPIPVLAPVTMATHPFRSTCSRYLNYLQNLYHIHYLQYLHYLYYLYYSLNLFYLQYVHYLHILPKVSTLSRISTLSALSTLHLWQLVVRVDPLHHHHHLPGHLQRAGLGALLRSHAECLHRVLISLKHWQIVTSSSLCPCSQVPSSRKLQCLSRL